MLRIEGKGRTPRAEPLETITVAGAAGGTVVARDGLGRAYFRGPARGRVRIVVGGAAGRHTVSLEDPRGRTTARAHFLVEPKTRIDDAGGAFAELLQTLLVTMLRFGEATVTRWRGRIYRYFVCWLRDHVHTLKGMKYFHADLAGAIDLYRESQRADGMIWDNVYPRAGPEPNAWDMRFGYGGFIRPFDDGTGEFRRIPVENDVEYLFVEGLYYTWKATGDDAWMAASLDAAVRALHYSITSPYRWSRKYGLLKRGYTIDTWDFQNAEDARRSAGGDPVSLAFGDAMAVRPGATRFGIMFGDNTGYAAACRYLAEMLDAVGRRREAAAHRRRARAIQRRLDRLAWNGRFFRHHVPEDRRVRRDLGVDESAQVSLSNAYSLNRGLTHAQCRAILRTYQGLRRRLPEGCPGEWFTIFPPFGKGFGGHNEKWQYMNGGVTPIVAGELARGAFEHGFEAYGADILRRVLALARSTRGHLHCAYTGSIPKPPRRRFTPLDLSALANADLSGRGAPGVPGWTGEGANDLGRMPTGRRRLAGVDFLIPDPARNGRRGCIALSTAAGYRRRAEVPVGRKAAGVYFLHTVSRAPGGVGGTVTLEYADGSRHAEHVIQGRNVAGWWMPEPCPAYLAKPTTAVAWRGRNRVCANVGVLAYGLDNPHPAKRIARIVLEASPAGGFYLVLGVTLSDRPVFFPPDPVSGGIPDNWGAAAVVYALVEGLAGVVDAATMYERARLAPRWAAAGVDRANATVTYPASGGYVAYRYRHDGRRKRLRLAVTGSGEECRCHVLLPPGARRATGVRVGGRPVAFRTTRVEKSRYADFTLAPAVPQDVMITYA